jgi:hypothetical protein
MRIRSALIILPLLFALVGCLPNKASSYKLITHNKLLTTQVNVLFKCNYSACKNRTNPDKYFVVAMMGTDAREHSDNWLKNVADVLQPPWGIYSEGSCESETRDEYRKCSFDFVNEELSARGVNPENLPDHTWMYFTIQQLNEGSDDTFSHSPKILIKDGLTKKEDRDIDGTANTSDNCINNFNPSQADVDDDGIGDVCDDKDDREVEEPSGGGGGEPADDPADDPDGDDPADDPDGDDPDADDPADDPDGDDPDGDDDGVLDVDDNCPLVANEDQDDEDLDGIGDACDADLSEGVDPTIEMDGGGCSLVASNSSNATPLLLLLATMLPMAIRKKFRK